MQEKEEKVEVKFSFKKILGNSMWPIMQNIVSLLASMLVSAIIARYLGTEGYGLVNYVVSVVMLFTSFSTLGMETFVVKDVVNDKNDEGNVIGTSFVIRLIGGFVLIIISQITLYILSPNDIMIQVLGLIMGICMIFKSFEVIEYYFQAKMNLKVNAIIKIITLVIVSTCKILVAVFNLGEIGYMCTYLADAIVLGLLLFIYFKLHEKIKWKFNKEYAKELLKKCLYVAISGLMITIYMRIDQVMLGSMLLDKSQNGIYSAAVKIAEMWYFIPLALIASFKPSIMKCKNMNNEEEYQRLMQRLYDIVAIIGVVCGLGITIVAPLAIRILYGEAYAQSAEILSISVWAGLFATLGSARSIWLVAENLQKYTISYTLAGCVINVTLNAILIPVYGAFGAAFATLIAQAISNTIVLMFFKETRKSSIMILKSIFKNQLIIDSVKKIINR